MKTLQVIIIHILTDNRYTILLC